MKVHRIFRVAANETFATRYSIAVICGYAGLFVMCPAEAQTLRGTAESVFNVIYGLVGVLSAISLLVCAINWKTGNFLGAHDPKKLFFSAMMGTALAFSVVGIVQFIKASVATSGGISGV